MHDIQEFKLDQVVRRLDADTKIALYGSAAYGLSIDDLIELSPNKQSPIDTSIPLNYAPCLGSHELRNRIAEIYSTAEAPLTGDNVIITPGSIMANYLVLTTTCVKGDHVICQFPTYGPSYIVPQYMNIDMEYWVMREENQWYPDIEELKAMIKPNTKAIILTNPGNPTGTTLSKETLDQIRDLAKQHNIIIFGDEVFRPLFHGDTPTPPSVVSLGYDKTVSTGSVSKAYSLPGIRVGWIISPNKEILHQIMAARDYTTLSVSRIDDAVALRALSKEVVPKILEQNLSLEAQNIKQYDDFVKKNSAHCRWVLPQGGGTGFIHFSDKSGKPIDDVAFADRLVREFGVGVIPGSKGFSEEGIADYKGYLRFNLSQKAEVVAEGLKLIEQALKDL